MGRAKPTRLRQRAAPLALGLGLAALVLVSPGLAAAQHASFAVITSRASAVDSVSLADLRGLLLGTKRYLGRTDQPACVVLPGPTRALLLQDVLGISEHDYGSAWRRAAFSGLAARPPLEVGDNAKVATFVFRVSHCLGFAHLAAGENIPERWLENIKLVSIDGHRLAEAGYPLVGP